MDQINQLVEDASPERARQALTIMFAPHASPVFGASKSVEHEASWEPDFWSGPSVLAIRPTDRIMEIQTKGGKVVRVASTTLDIAKHTADVTFKLWALANNKLVGETCETHHLRYFFPMEFELFLSNAGFQLESLSAFPSLDDPLTSESWNALAVCSAI